MKFTIMFFMACMLAHFTIRPCVALSPECDNCLAECTTAANAYTKVSGENFWEVVERCSASKCRKPGGPCENPTNVSPSPLSLPCTRCREICDKNAGGKASQANECIRKSCISGVSCLDK